MTITTDRPVAARRRMGLLDPGTYRISVHLLTDLVVGTVTFSAMVALLAASAGLIVTLVGIPLLAGALLVARWIGTVERARAAGVLGIRTVDPVHASGGSTRNRLADRADWRAVAYAVLLLPVGVVTGALTLVGWTTAVAAIASPVYVGQLDDASSHFAGIDLQGPVPVGITVLLGIVLLVLMPAVVRGLARLDAVLLRRFLS